MGAVKLRRLDTAKDMARVYLLDVQQDLFGQWWFVREFGRIGAAGTIKLDFFPTEAEAQSRGTEAPREGAARLCSIATP